MRITHLFLLGLVLLTPFTAAAQEKVQITRDIHYGAHEKQILDIYQSEKCIKNTCPVVMWVHGGGWRNGDTGGAKSTQMQSAWAQQGIIMVGINYRLTPDVQHPIHVQDVAAAIGWVYNNISKHNGDPARISLLGHSAGAHLVALVATNPKFLAHHNLAPAQVIQNVFPIDTASFDLTDKSSRFVGKLVKNAFGTDQNVLIEASPNHQVHKGGQYPDFIIAAAKVRDDAVNTSKILQRKLTLAGAGAQLIIMDYPKMGQLKAHGAIATDLIDPNNTMTKTLLQRVLSGG